ncbi:hypothetical protein BJX76DRAFT_344509 [Aspergillus varians]
MVYRGIPNLDKMNGSLSLMATTLTDGAYEWLSQLLLNGRQIKNVIKTTTLLSCHQEQSLSMEQIRAVLSASRELDVASTGDI